MEQLSAPRDSEDWTQWTVSIHELAHKVPKEAWKEYKKGQASLNKNDYQSAQEHLQNALIVDPQFADAYNDLGVIHFRRNNVELAVKQFQRAVELVPDHIRANLNLALGLFKLQRYQDAGAAAQRALKVNAALSKMHFVLGISLIQEGGRSEEALKHLTRAAREIPNAHLVASELLAQSGRRAEAVQQVEQYLRSEDPAVDRARVEAWLAELRR